MLPNHVLEIQVVCLYDKYDFYPDVTVFFFLLVNR